jgi:catechol 2,3-dioxygenase-like lactoylglutathione lyase family enzyme
MSKLSIALVAFVAGLATTQAAKSPPQAKPADAPLRLGNFSVSLTVKDIAKSREFYEKLGFHVVAGEQAQKWLVLQNDTSTIGVFQGMFPRNTLTYNPGWDRDKKTLADFDDVRAIQKRLKEKGIALTTQADESTTGPASLTFADPDGNPILLDQFVPAPKK